MWPFQLSFLDVGNHIHLLRYCCRLKKVIGAAEIGIAAWKHRNCRKS